MRDAEVVRLKKEEVKRSLLYKPYADLNELENEEGELDKQDGYSRR